MASVLFLYVLVLAATTISAQNPVKWTTLHVKWTIHELSGYFAGLGFYKMPLTIDAATSKGGWKQAASTNLTTIWCLWRDPRVCMLYDLQGTVAGMQISFPVADVVFPANDSVDNHPLLFKNNMYDKELYSARYYLVDQATLAAGGRPPSEEVGTGLWLQSGPDLVEVPRDRDLLEAQSWTRQSCNAWMGRHYQYNMSKDMSCRDLQPYFLLLNDNYNTLHGVGLQMFGKPSVQLKKWFDDIPTSSIKWMFPNAPPCMKKMADNFGITFLHIYFIENPFGYVCPPKIRV